MKRKLLLLLFWMIATLFPFGWLTLFSRSYADMFNFVFDTEASHVVMHAAIFCGLMILLAVTFASDAQPSGRKELWRLLLMWLVVALLAGAQELIQLF